MTIQADLVGADPRQAEVVNGMDNEILGTTIIGELTFPDPSLDGPTVEAVLTWALGPPNSEHGETYESKQKLLKAVLAERMLQSAGLTVVLGRNEN